MIGIETPELAPVVIGPTVAGEVVIGAELA